MHTFQCVMYILKQLTTHYNLKLLLLYLLNILYLSQIEFLQTIYKDIFCYFEVENEILHSVYYRFSSFTCRGNQRELSNKTFAQIEILLYNKRTQKIFFKQKYIRLQATYNLNLHI